jgi:glycosyltransferase involved in cell wall biosynthesis
VTGRIVENMENSKIAFSWNGLPQYAARLMKTTIDRLRENCTVIGSQPCLPVRGMEEVLGQAVHWVDASQPVSWSELGLEVPLIFVQSGWSYPAFCALGREVKASGGKVIGISDANWRGDLRQLALGPVGFRALHRKHFDAMIVPGRQGERLMRYFGMAADTIHTGLYGADPALFNGGPPLAERRKTLLYIGQFIERKNVLGLVEAFLKFSSTDPEWRLHLVGGGEQSGQIPQHARIIVEDFVQPEQLAERYRSARFFILPSLVEAWGLVVHEATLCGCGLVLSDAIGSGDDLATKTNAVRFTAGSEDDLVQALINAAGFDPVQLAGAEKKSRELARQFGPERFAKEVVGLVEQIRDEDAQGNFQTGKVSNNR